MDTLLYNLRIYLLERRLRAAERNAHLEAQATKQARAAEIYHQAQAVRLLKELNVLRLRGPDGANATSLD